MWEIPLNGSLLPLQKQRQASLIKAETSISMSACPTDVPLPQDNLQIEKQVCCS